MTLCFLGVNGCFFIFGKNNTGIIYKLTNCQFIRLHVSGWLQTNNVNINGVGFDKLQVENLPRPHGTCISHWPKYEYFTGQQYSRTKCKMDRKTQFVWEKCDCKEYYMPDTLNGSYCSLEAYIHCAREAEGKCWIFTDTWHRHSCFYPRFRFLFSSIPPLLWPKPHQIQKVTPMSFLNRNHCSISVGGCR